MTGKVETPKAADPIKTDIAAGVDVEATEIRKDIAQTRAEMGGTIEALHGKLNPAVLKEQAIDQFHEAKETIKAELQQVKDSLKAEVKAEIDEVKAAVREATVGKVEHMVHDAQTTVTETSRSVFDTVRANPIPVALIGMGVAWLLVSARKSASASREYRGQYNRGPSMGGSTYTRGQYLGGSAYSGGQYMGGDDRRTPTRAEYDRGEYNRGQYGGSDYRGEQDEHGGVVETLQRTAGTVADKVGSLAHQAQSSISGAGHTVADKVSGAGHTVADKAGHLADRAGNLAHQAQASISGAGHTVADKAGHLVDRAGNLAHQAQASISGATHAAGQSMSHLAHDVQAQGRRMENQVEHMFYENPLLIGAGALALGTVIGLAVPISRKEDEWMGKARDQVMDRAQALAHEALGKVEGVARNVADEANNALTQGDRQQQGGQQASGARQGGQQGGQQWGRDPYLGSGQSGQSGQSSMGSGQSGQSSMGSGQSGMGSDQSGQQSKETGGSSQSPNGNLSKGPSSYRSI